MILRIKERNLEKAEKLRVYAEIDFSRASDSGTQLFFYLGKLQFLAGLC